jgi:hypothetical protein
MSVNISRIRNTVISVSGSIAIGAALIGEYDAMNTHESGVTPVSSAPVAMGGPELQIKAKLIVTTAKSAIMPKFAIDAATMVRSLHHAGFTSITASVDCQNEPVDLMPQQNWPIDPTATVALVSIDTSRTVVGTAYDSDSEITVSCVATDITDTTTYVAGATGATSATKTPNIPIVVIPHHNDGHHHRHILIIHHSIHVHR